MIEYTTQVKEFQKAIELLKAETIDSGRVGITQRHKVEYLLHFLAANIDMITDSYLEL
jgi:hypothetical protein